MSDAILNQKPSELTEEQFLAVYGGIYEHSPWIASGALTSGQNIDTVDGLHGAMKRVISEAAEPDLMALICAHPDLAGKLAVGEELTAESTAEQKGAGLDKCSPEEFEEFQQLNTDYKMKFGFPYIIAVKGLGRQRILANFRARINNDRETEFNTALQQINRIAYFRLVDLAE